MNNNLKFCTPVAGRYFEKFLVSTAITDSRPAGDKGAFAATLADLNSKSARGKHYDIA